MIEMTLSSRHRIRQSSPGGLRPSTLPLGHGGSPKYWLSHVDGEETFLVSFKPPRPETEPRTLAWKAAVLTTTLGPPPLQYGNRMTVWNQICFFFQKSSLLFWLRDISDAMYIFACSLKESLSDWCDFIQRPYMYTSELNVLLVKPSHCL